MYIVVQSPTHVWLFVTPKTAAHQTFLKFAQGHAYCISDAIYPFHPLMPCSSVLNPSSIRHFSNKLVVHIRWPKYWSFSISPSNEYSGLTSLKIDWLDLQGFAVQGTLRSLLQHHILKASILWCSNFMTVQLSQLYVTTRKTIALTKWTFVSRVMSLLFNMLSLSSLSCQEANIIWSQGCSHHLQWF